MKLYPILFLFSLLFLTACQETISSNNSKIKEENWSVPQLINFFENDTISPLIINKIASNHNSVFYIGNKKGRFNLFTDNLLNSIHYYQFNNVKENLINNKNLKLFVDTAQSYNRFYPTSLLFIRNPTDDSCFVRLQDGAFIMIQEAKDSNGIWRPIEYWIYSWCGNSYSAYPIPPKYYAVTTVPRYSGEFKTELRVKLKTGENILYSNTYYGRINSEQFDTTNVSEFNGGGNHNKMFLE